MAEKKYKLLENDTVKSNGTLLYRIEALIDFSDVKAGDKGGYIEKEFNLSHERNAWVYDEARVYGDAQIRDNAQVKDYACVSDNAWVHCDAMIYDNALVYGNACLYHNARVFGDARVCGDSDVYHSAHVYEQAVVKDDAEVMDAARVYGLADISGLAKIGGNAHVSGTSNITGLALVFGDARIASPKDIITIHPIGPHNDTFTAYPHATGSIIVSQTSFFGRGLGSTLSELEPRVESDYKDDPEGDEYKMAIQLIKTKFKNII